MSSFKTVKLASGNASPQNLSPRDRSRQAQVEPAQQLPPKTRVLQSQSQPELARVSQQQIDVAALFSHNLAADRNVSRQPNSPRPAARGSPLTEVQTDSARRQQMEQDRRLAADGQQTSTLSSQKQRQLAVLERKLGEMDREVTETSQRLTELSQQMSEAKREVAETGRKIQETECSVTKSNAEYADLTKAKVLCERRLALESLDRRWREGTDKVKGLAQQIGREIENERPKDSLSARDRRIVTLVEQIIAQVHQEHGRGVQDFLA